MSATKTTRSAIIIKRLTQALALLAAMLATAGAMAAAEILDRVAIIVDDDIVMSSELSERVAEVNRRLAQQDGPRPTERELHEAITEQMILESLQLQMARRAGVKISDAQLNAAMARIAEQNGMDLDQFREQLTDSGVSYSTARERVRREQTIQQVQAGAVRAQVQLSEQEVNNFLLSAEGRALTAPRYRISHILWPVEAGDDLTREKQMQTAAAAAAAEIAAGPSLLEWLAAHNRRSASPLQGGDLGWRRAEELPAIFTATVTELEPGGVSAPIRSGSGFHLVQLNERRGGPQIVAQTLARHILLKPSAIRSDEQCRELLESLRNRALAGEDFGDLARQYTDDFASAREGGDLGWAQQGKYTPGFEAAMNDTATNEISEPFRSQFGWHIVQVLERRKHDISDEAHRELASNHLFQRKFQDELEAWLQKIRDQAYVDIKS